MLIKLCVVTEVFFVQDQSTTTDQRVAAMQSPPQQPQVNYSSSIHCLAGYDAGQVQWQHASNFTVVRFMVGG